MNEKLRKAISAAIKKEEYSYRLYTKAYKKAELKGSKQLFKKLAAQELKHKKILQNLNLKEFETIKIKFNIAKSLMLTPLSEIRKLKIILRTAIKREQESYDYYIKISKAFSGKIKLLFKKLASQEKTHKKLIQKEYEKMFS